MMYDCLIVDDDVVLAENTSEYLNLSDVSTTYVTNAGDCEEFLEKHSVSIILMDVNLDKDNGFALCKKIREYYKSPIIFVSARTSDDDIVLALSIGGDDYIAKPYSLSVLCAKVKATLRRMSEGLSQSDRKERKDVGDNRLLAGPVCVHLDSGIVYKNDEKLTLREKEYDLLVYLISNTGRIISKNELFENVWNDRFTGDNTLNVHIRHLREKIEKDPNNPEIIKTVWGRGYCIE